MKTGLIFIFLISVSFLSINILAEDMEKNTLEYISKNKIHHENNGKFFNPWANDKTSFWDLLKWKFFSKNKFGNEKEKKIEFIIEKPDFSYLNAKAKSYFLWLGHSTVLIKTSDKVIITDPVFWDLSCLVKRKTPFPIEPKKIPKIDYVLISHGHYDHLDKKSLEFLKEKYDPYFISGPGYKKIFSAIGITKHIQLDWWESYEIDGIKITSLPTHHWSKRTPFDINEMLWCGFLIENDKIKYYWIGDTGYFNGYKEIGEKFGPIDFLFAPIGAYEPRWFMKDYHVNPEEALQIAEDVKAVNFIPIHWGTFDLSDEPLGLPIKHLKEIQNKSSNISIKILKHGGHLVVN